jgi:cell division transport system permease protein
MTSLRVLGLRHLQVFFYSLGKMSRHPLSTLMTAAVIGIALALPSGLHLILKNAETLSGGWDGATQISLFLKRGVSEKEARLLEKRIRRLPTVDDIKYISRKAALEEFRQLSGFGGALDTLKENPLPSVLLIQPSLQASDPEAARSLLTRLEYYPEVDVAQLDMQWVKRLHAILETVRRGVLVLAILLSLAVLLVVGNTIKLAIQNRREEIVVMKLIGGTDSFIRRPFLYSGFWYGLFGSIIAFLMVQISLLTISGPMETLTGLYQHNFALIGLNMTASLILIFSGIFLGLAGSWLAVGRHLREIEPQ